MPRLHRLLQELALKVADPAIQEFLGAFEEALNERLRRQNELVTTVMGNVELTTSDAILALRQDFLVLSTLIKDNNRRNNKDVIDRLEGIGHKLHNLSNQMMVFNAKLDDIVALLTSDDNGS